MLKSEDFSIFYWAAKVGQTESLKFLWSICPDNLKPKMLKADDFSAICEAAQFGHIDSMEYLLSICPDDQKINMIKAEDFRVFRSASFYGRIDTLKNLWSICPDDQKRNMLQAINFGAFINAATRGETETLKYLWSICPDDLKNEMLKANNYLAFTGAASHGQFDSLEYLFNLCNDRIYFEALDRLEEDDRDLMRFRMGQRRQISSNYSEFNIDSFNSLFDKTTHNKNYAKFLLACRKPEASTALPCELFYELSSYIIGKDVHKPHIKDAVEAASMVMEEGYDIRSQAALLKARKSRFGLDEELDKGIHNEHGSGCVIS